MPKADTGGYQALLRIKSLPYRVFSSGTIVARVAANVIPLYNQAEVEGPKLLSFRLEQRKSAMKVKEAMHKGVDWVSPDTPVTELGLHRDLALILRPSRLAKTTG